MITEEKCPQTKAPVFKKLDEEKDLFSRWFPQHQSKKMNFVQQI